MERPLRPFDVRGVGTCVLTGLMAVLAAGGAARACLAQDGTADSPVSGEQAGAQPEEADPLLAPVEWSERKQPPKPDKDHPGDPAITIDWGFGPSVAARRYIPVIVSITGGLDPFSGFITFRYRSDSTQAMVVTVPVAATPNKTSVYTPVLSYPGSGDKIEVTLSERSGRVVQTYWYAPSPGDTEIQLPQVHADPEPLVIAIGGRESAASSVLSMRSSAVPSRVNPTQDLPLGTAMVDPANLPLLPWAYESVSVAVVQSDAVRAMDERAMAALREWVLAGGWVVVIASNADESWTSWFPGREVPVRLAQATTEPPPDSLVHLVTTEVKLDQSDLLGRFPTTTWATWRDSPQWMLGPTISESVVKSVPPVPPSPEPAIAATPVDDKVEAAAQATVRWISVTPAGRRAGWSTGLTRAPIVPASDMGPASRWMGAGGEGSEEGLIAHGPVGYGWMTVLGFDPRKVSAQVTSKGNQRVWARVLGLSATVRAPGEPTPRVLRGPPPPLANGWSGWAAAAGDGWGLALPLALDAVASAEAPGRSVFLMVALAAAMVPLLIGPVDYLLMRRSRVAHRSWLTALGWIGLASVAAWLMPLTMRSSTTTVSRLNVVDVMMPVGGGAAGGVPGEPLTLQTGITGVFSGGSIRGTLTGIPDRAAVRGVAAETAWDSDDGSRFGGELPVAQAGPGLDAAPGAEPGEGGDVWGGFADRGEAFGDRLLETGWRLWTFRAVEDRARVRGKVGASVERLNGGRAARVRVTGLPAGAVVRRGAVLCNGVWRELEIAKGGAAQEGDALVLNSGGPVDRAVWEPRPGVRVDSGSAYYDAEVGPTLDKTPGAALALRGPYERGDAIGSYLDSGAWDAVYLHVTGLAATASLGDSTTSTEQAVYRIVIPGATEGLAR